MWVRPASARPTPTTRDHKGGGTATVRSDGKVRNDMLDWVAESWPSPTVADSRASASATAGGAETRVGYTPGVNLTDAIVLWSTPRSSDGEKGGPNQAFGAGGVPLPAQATSFHQAHPTYPVGQTSSHPRRSLNPLFVEWLMGWPPGWTLGVWIDFACSATELCRFKQRMRSALSAIALPSEAPPAQLALFG